MPRAMPPERAYVGIGSNLCDPAAQVRAALVALAPLGRVRASSLYRSEPVGDPGQPWYVNAVAQLDTQIGAHDLLRALQGIESRAGRPVARPKGAPRTLDLDLLLFGAREVDEPGLQIPHPRYRERRFVLVPLLELVPGMADPRDGVPLAATLAALPARPAVERIGESGPESATVPGVSNRAGAAPRATDPDASAGGLARRSP